MANICKNLARLVPSTSPVADLTGILFEADENAGSLRLAGTNMEISLECTCGAVVAEGGRMVVNANLIAGMMPLLKEDTVSFAVSPAGNTVRIESGSTVYDISCLPGKHFPEPGAAPPDNMVKISGLAGLVRQTAFAAKKKAGAPGDVLMNAKLDVYPSETHMTCTDGSMLASERQSSSRHDAAAKRGFCFVHRIPRREHREDRKREHGLRHIMPAGQALPRTRRGSAGKHGENQRACGPCKADGFCREEKGGGFRRCADERQAGRLPL